MIEFSREKSMYLFDKCDKSELYNKQCCLVLDVLQLQFT